jgi:homoserine kinase
MKETITACATSANLGSGFDSLGLQIPKLYDTLEVIWGDDLNSNHTTDKVKVIKSGMFAQFGDTVSTDQHNLIYKLIAEELLRLGVDTDFKIVCHNSVPHSRGLGSSSVAIVLALRAALRIHAEVTTGSSQVEDEDAKVFARGLEIEGHPDNVAPCVFSGIQLSTADGSSVTEIRIPQPLRIELLVNSERGLPTKQARAILPEAVAFNDAVVHGRNFANMILGLQTGDNKRLFDGTNDILHQPYRRELYADSMKLVDLGRSCGIPMAISGAGTTVIAFWFEDSEITSLFDQLFLGIDSKWHRYSS